MGEAGHFYGQPDQRDVIDRIAELGDGLAAPEKCKIASDAAVSHQQVLYDLTGKCANRPRLEGISSRIQPGKI
jgi:hypothetical protein